MSQTYHSRCRPVFPAVAVVFLLTAFSCSFIITVQTLTLTSNPSYLSIINREYDDGSDRTANEPKKQEYSVERNSKSVEKDQKRPESFRPVKAGAGGPVRGIIVSYGTDLTSEDEFRHFRHGFDRWLYPWEVDWAAGIPGVEPNRQIFLSSPPITGSDVQELQIGLKKIGFYDGAATGVFDRNTWAAVRRFQAARGLEANGIVRSGTWVALEEEVSRVEQAPKGEARPPGKDRPLSAPSVPPGPVEIVVDLKTLSLTLYSGGLPIRTYPIAIGKSNTPTPIGEFKVINKKVNPGGPFGSRWMGLNIPWGIYGIHGTNRPWSIGSHASAGCIRMHNHDVAELFDQVPIGTRVTIKGREFSAGINRVMKIGNTGKDVQYVQQVLRRMGYDAGPLDGYFGPLLQEAVLQMQSFYGLPPTGEIGETELYVMGIK
ncbi:MAG TPA: L,D-transpeptidase family protein [Clostridia bacterium]|nr:L,D-transpeptidase family protein [Clostridia bacterium]